MTCGNIGQAETTAQVQVALSDTLGIVDRTLATLRDRGEEQAFDYLYRAVDDLIERRRIQELDIVFGHCARLPLDLLIGLLTVSLPVATELTNRFVAIDTARAHAALAMSPDETARLLRGL